MKIKSVVAMLLIMIFSSITYGSWAIEYETNNPQDENGNGIPPRGIPMFRVYEGTLKVNVDSQNNQIVVHAETFSHAGGSATGEKGYLFCLFFKAAPCQDCKGSGEQYNKRCIQCNGRGSRMPMGKKMAEYVINTEDQFVMIDSRGVTEGKIDIPYDAEYALFLVYRNYSTTRPSTVVSNNLENGLYAILNKYGKNDLAQLSVRRR